MNRNATLALRATIQEVLAGKDRSVEQDDQILIAGLKLSEDCLNCPQCQHRHKKKWGPSDFVCAQPDMLGGVFVPLSKLSYGDFEYCDANFNQRKLKVMESNRKWNLEISSKSDFYLAISNNPDKRGFDLIVHIQEGSGDNLDQQDLDAGYVDYIYFDTWDGVGTMHGDGGMALLTKPYGELSVDEIINQTLSLAGFVPSQQAKACCLTD